MAIHYEHKRKIYIKNAISIFDSIKKDNYENHSFLFHIGSRFLVSYNLLFESSTYHIPYSFENANLFEKIIKINTRIIYYIVMLTPFLYLPYYIRRYKYLSNYLIDFSYISFLGFISLYAFLFRTTEFRFNHMMYLFCMVITINALVKLFDNKMLRKYFTSN